MGYVQIYHSIPSYRQRWEAVHTTCDTNMPLSSTDIEERQAREQYLNRPLPNELR